jgi:glycosyltransferase involved in cell wall biosynthesis
MRVSAIVAVYNGADRLGEAVDSILSQDDPPFEIIVVDDGSNDETPGVIRAYERNIRAFHQPNSGLAAAHNLGLKHADGDAVSFLDHDDLWPKGRLAAMTKLMQSDGAIDVVSGQVKIEVEDEKLLAVHDQSRLVTTYRPWSVQSLLIRRNVFDQVGFFDTRMTQGMDIDWYIRARESGVRYAFLPEITLIYRFHGSNMTSNASELSLDILRAFKNSIDRRRSLG